MLRNQVIAVLGICLSQAAAQADDVFVSSLNNDEVLRFDGDSGVFIDTFVAAGVGGLNEPHGTMERCDDVLVCSFATHEVLRYDRTTGAFIDVFIDSSNGLSNPVYLLHGPDDNLYLSSQGSNEILRYAPEGVFIDVFVSAGSGGINGPSGFAFGPDGRLYVAGRNSGTVVAYDGASGTFDEVIADTTDGLGAGNTFGLTVGSNDDIYFVSNNAVWRYDLDTDALIATIPLAFPIGMGPGPGGEIVVANANNLFTIDPVTDVVSAPILSGGAINTLNFFRFAGAAGGPNCSAPIPAASTWGVLLLAAGLMACAALVVRRREASPGQAE